MQDMAQLMEGCLAGGIWGEEGADLRVQEQALTGAKKPNLRAGRAPENTQQGNSKASLGLLSQSPASSCLTMWDALQRHLSFEGSLQWVEVL